MAQCQSGRNCQRFGSSKFLRNVYSLYNFNTVRYP